jgi:hypothetical protein
VANQAHHDTPEYRRARRLVVTAARANPHAVCWSDGLTLDQHEPGPTRRWSGGHTIDGVNGPAWLDVERPPPAGQPWIAPEVLRCNIRRGNRGRHLNGDTGYTWP